MAEVDCVKFKINIKCSQQEEKTVYRAKFTRKISKFEAKATNQSTYTLPSTTIIFHGLSSKTAL